MAHDRHRATAPGPAVDRGVLAFLLGAALVVVGALTLTPDGAGWTYGAPLDELRWYAAGLESATTVLQLLGNLGLLVVPATLVVALWPATGRLTRLTGLAVAAGIGIEALQWVLPLGRVVSPLDAGLNAAGAVAAGLLVRATASPPRTGQRGVTS